MSLLQEFFIIAAVICAFSGCASVSMDKAVEATSVSATSDSKYLAADEEVLGTIYFDYDKYDLHSISISEIRDIAKSILTTSARVRVEGHCDERGTREYNLALGEKRAIAVSEILIINGVPSSKITVVSYGEERPVAYESNETSWAKNRRAVIEVF